MIDTIIGKIKHKDSNYVILSNNGIGYRIYTSNFSMSQLELNETEEMYTELVVREDDMSLYGFTTDTERQVYNLLTTVSRIGPRVAIGILSGMTMESIVTAIKTEDVAMLTTAPGVGKKTAERIILELKDKVDNIEIQDVDISVSPIHEAQSALEHLGYSSYEVLDILKEIYEEDMSVEELIRLTLRQIG